MKYTDHRISFTLASNDAVSLNGFERNLFWENTGDGFEWKGALSGIDSSIDARSFAVGDLDLVVKNLHRKLLEAYRNDSDGRDGKGISLRFVGTKSNRDGIGTRVVLTQGDRRVMQEVRSASGFQSQSPNEVYFGLGKAPKADRIEGLFPSGEQHVLAGLRAGHRIVVHEADGIVSEVPFEDPGTSGLASLTADQKTDIARDAVFSNPRDAHNFKTSGFDTKALYRRPTLMCFTTTWSATLDRDLEVLGKLRESYRDLEVVVLYVNVPGATYDPSRFERTQALGFQVGRSRTDLASLYAQQSSLTFPSTFLVVDSRILVDSIGPLDEAKLRDAMQPHVRAR